MRSEILQKSGNIWITVNDFSVKVQGNQMVNFKFFVLKKQQQQLKLHM